ncbi:MULTISPECIES: acetyl-CoA carboxylase biotin carboxylase subunit [unclassified Nocardiopsis]|uniref:acetyl-CoA carboxylase biotin carboxylase subunit n=1 Tax=unclassified Nocardiopsis TaxID=2649073 RepID=UPI0013571F15|nr:MULTISPECIES: acetyl-CoA carboxylase biotin carboxylase subunit [unclassified Nocardiopsis]
MFEKILVANRGEIALRVVRACRELGVRSVAVYSRADADSAAVRAADEAVCIGPEAPGRSYLNIPNIIGAALMTGADAVHPGYGFLSEDPDFARICAEEGLAFIGPPPDVMAALGDKSSARRIMAEVGLPLLPGTVEPVVSAEEAAEVADRIGYPVVLKAVAGGGGRGITVVRDPADLPRALRTTRANAQALFRDPSVYLERYLEGARHIEVQVVADDHGNTVHLGERDCSVQRRNQKLVEESPSPVVGADLRERIGKDAVRACEAVGYRGVGTMEFLLDPEGRHWFMEMNTRIQVEHPVTEMVTQIDLVAEQIRVAAGAPLSFSGEQVRLRGHAIECRINAEDPERDFAPAPGRLDRFEPPGGPWVRVDTHCVPGSTVPPYYDSMIAKVIVWGEDRDAALNRLRRALEEFRIEGPGTRTTLGFHRRLVDHGEFRAGAATTDFLTRHTV